MRFELPSTSARCGHEAEQHDAGERTQRQGEGVEHTPVGAQRAFQTADQPGEADGGGGGQEAGEQSDDADPGDRPHTRVTQHSQQPEPDPDCG